MNKHKNHRGMNIAVLFLMKKLEKELLNIHKRRIAKWFMYIYEVKYYLAMRRQISIDNKRDPCYKKHGIKYYD